MSQQVESKAKDNISGGKKWIPTIIAKNTPDSSSSIYISSPVSMVPSYSYQKKGSKLSVLLHTLITALSSSTCSFSYPLIIPVPGFRSKKSENQYIFEQEVGDAQKQSTSTVLVKPKEATLSSLASSPSLFLSLPHVLSGILPPSSNSPFHQPVQFSQTFPMPSVSSSLSVVNDAFTSPPSQSLKDVGPVLPEDAAPSKPLVTCLCWTEAFQSINTDLKNQIIIKQALLMGTNNVFCEYIFHLK
jgi:hypothetical protein